MPRRAAAVRRETQPDAKFNNRLVTQLINKVLLDGKKSIAENIVYGAFDLVQEKTGEDPLTVFKKAMDNVRPTLECKPKRVGGATYQVPMEVNSRRATTLAIRWIVDFSRKRKEHTMRERLAPLYKAAAVVAIVLTLSNAAQFSFRNDNYTDVQSPAHTSKGASVALNDSASIDTLKQSNLDATQPAIVPIMK